MSLAENIALVDQLKAELDRLRPLSKDAEEKLWSKLRLEWNYNSNHIEGNTLTYGETMLLLLHDKTSGDHQKREYDEMQAHDVAVYMVRDWAKEDRPLSEADIKNLNKIILVKPFWKEAITADGQPTRRLIKIGDYKDYPNHVRLKNGEIFRYATPEETPRLMQELVEWFNSVKEVHPVILAAELHYRYIRIHPFDDGNGRIARLLVNYVLLKNGYTPIIIKSAEKEAYLTALQKADSGDKETFYSYIGEQLVWSLNLEIKSVKGESLEEPDDLSKEISIIKKNTSKSGAERRVRSAENIVDMLENNVIPILKMIDEKVNELKPLFFDTFIKIDYEVMNDGHTVSAPFWATLIGLKNTLYQRKFNLDFIKYSCELNGLRYTDDNRNMWLGIDFYFDPYNYRVKTPDIVNPYTFPYGKILTDEVKYEIIKPMIKSVVEELKRIL